MNREKEARLESLAANDTAYQTLLQHCLAAEPEFLRIRNMLPPEDQILLEQYLSLCEELDHRRLSLALTL